MSLVKVGINYPITRVILHLQPALSWKEANRHANAIYNTAQKYNLDWVDITAIAFKESSFLFSKGDGGCGYTLDGERKCVYNAFGYMQVDWDIWGEVCTINLDRLIKELDYGYYIGGCVIADIFHRYVGDRYNIGRYNSGTKKYKLQYFQSIRNIQKQINKYLEGLVNK